MSERKKIGIVLVGYGVPRDCTTKAISKFCKEILFDRDLVSESRLTWWFKVRFGMLKDLSDEHAKSLRTLWPDGDFPEWPTLELLCQQLQHRLSSDDNIVVRAATLFGEYRVVDAFRQIKAENCNKLIVLPLFPQASYSTSGLVHQRVESAKKHLHWSCETTLVDNYHDNHAYVCALAASIEHAGFDAEKGDKLLIAYHSIPTADIEKGDTYEIQAGATSLLIASELGLARNAWTMAFFAAPYDIREHLDPYARDVVKRWGQFCEGRMFVVCPGYATEGIRTQYYVNHTLKNHFIKYRSGEERSDDRARNEAADNFVYVPTLGKTRAHLKVLTTILDPFLEEGE